MLIVSSGVKEYVVWPIYEYKIDGFRWREGAYLTLEPDRSSVVKSEVFPELWLTVPALLQRKLTEVLSVLQQSGVTPEYANFVEQLRSGS